MILFSLVWHGKFYNWKTKNVTKLKKMKLWQNSKTEIVTKLKKSNCDKTKKNQILTKLKNSSCDKTQSLKLWQTKKIKLWKLKKTNCDKTQFMANFLKSLLVRSTWHLDNRWDVLRSAMFLHSIEDTRLYVGPNNNRSELSMTEGLK